MTDTCANAYLYDGGVFLLDSCSTSHLLAVCQAFISLCDHTRRGNSRRGRAFFRVNKFGDERGRNAPNYSVTVGILRVYLPDASTELTGFQNMSVFPAKPQSSSNSGTAPFGCSYLPCPPRHCCRCICRLRLSTRVRLRQCRKWCVCVCVCVLAV